MPNATVDERIVEMRIDSAKFEAGAKKTIKILESLDDNLDSLAHGNFDQLGDTLDTVNKRFSAMGIVGDQVIRNLTNKAMELVGQMTRLGKSMTVDQVAAGWSKYASKTEAVQTIMAATAASFSDQEEQMAVVNEQLEKLNWFTDETSYSFLDMVSNIGKFTSNGMGLEESVTAMQGISTWAAISGANVGEASRAMYNLSQALAVGSVKLIDWKSIENANMATREFKQTALDTAVALGTLTEESDGMYKTLEGHLFNIDQFNQQLSDGWFSRDVLMQTLQQYGGFTDALNMAHKATELEATDLLTLVDLYMKVDGAIENLNYEDAETFYELSSQAAEDTIPWLKALSDSEFELGRKSFIAAQEAKTFEEALNAVRDAASTKWMGLFEMMFGSYTTAKKFWTSVANGLYDIFVGPLEDLEDKFKVAFGPRGIDGELTTLRGELAKAGRSMADFERAFREIDDRGVTEILDSYDSLEDAILKGRVSTETFRSVLQKLSEDTESGAAGAVETIDEKIEELRVVATAVIRGEYNNGEERRKMLEELGYNYEMIQFIADTMIGEPETDTKTILERYHPEYLVELARSAGYTEEQIAAMAAMLEHSDELLVEFADSAAIAAAANDPQNWSGQRLLTDGLTNIIEAIGNIITAIKNAKALVFGTAEQSGERLHSLLVIFYKLTDGFKSGTEVIADLSEKFEDVFQVVRDTVGVIGGALFKGLKIAFGFAFSILTTIFGIVSNIFHIIAESGIIRAFGNALMTVFSALAMPIVIIADLIGDLISKFRTNVASKWTERLTTVFKTLSLKVQAAADSFKSFIESSRMIQWLTSKTEELRILIDKIGERTSLIFGRLKTAYKKNGISGMFHTARIFIAGLLKDHPKLLAFFNMIANAISMIASVAQGGLHAITGWFKNFEFENIKKSLPSFKEVLSFIVGLVATIFNKLANVIRKIDLSKVVAAIKEVFAKIDIAGAFSNFIDAIKEFFDKNVNFGLIGDRFIERIMEFIDIVRQIVMIGSVGGVSFGLTRFLTSTADFFDGLWEIFKATTIRMYIGAFSAAARALLFLAFAIGMLIGAILIIAKIPTEDLQKGFEVIAVLLLELSVIVGSLAFTDPNTKRGLIGALGIALGVYILAIALQKLSAIDRNDLFTGIIGLIACLMAFGRLLSIMTTFYAAPADALRALLPAAIAIVLVAFTFRMLSKLDLWGIAKGMIALGFIVERMRILMVNAAHCTDYTALKYLTSMAIAVLLFALTIKVLSKMRLGETLKGMLILDQIIFEINRIIRRCNYGNYTGLKNLIPAVLLMISCVLVMKIVATMSFGDILKGTIGLWLVLNQVIRITQVIGKEANAFKEMHFIWRIIAIAVALVVMALALRILGSISFGGILKGVLALWAVIRSLNMVLHSLAVTTKLGEKEKSGAILHILSVLLLIGGIIFALYILSKMNFSEILKAVILLSMALRTVGKLMRNFSRVSKNVRTLDSGLGMFMTLLGIIALLFGIVYALKLLSKEDPGAMFVTLLIIMVALWSVGRLMRRVSTLPRGEKAYEIFLTFLGVAIIIVAIAYALRKLSGLSTESLFASAASLLISLIGISILLTAFGKTASALGRDSFTKFTESFVFIFLTIGTIVAALIVLSNIETGRLITSAIALFGGLLAVAGILYAFSKINITNVENIIFITGLLGVIAIALAMLSDYNFKQLGSSAIVLVSALIGITASMYLLSKATTAISRDNLLGLLIMIGIVITIAAALVALSNIDSLSISSSVIALVATVLGVTAALYLLSKTGKSVNLRTLLAVAVMVGAFVAIARVLNEVLKSGNDWKSIGSLSGVILATLLGLIGGFIVLGAAGKLAIKGLGVFAAIIVGISAVIFGIAWVVNKLSLMEPLKKFISGLVDVANTMNDLSIDQSTLEKAAILMVLLVELCAIEVLGLIATGLAYVIELIKADFGAAITTLVTSTKTAVEAIDSLSVSEDTITKAGYLIDVLLAICVAEVLGLLANILADLLSLTSHNFGEELTTLVTSILPFLDVLRQNIRHSDVRHVEMFGSVMKAIGLLECWSVLAEVADAIRRGVSKIAKGDLGNNLKGLAESINGFLEETAKMTDDSVASTQRFSSIMQALAISELWGTLITILDSFNSSHSPDGFMGTVTNLAKSIPNFVSNLSGISADDATNAQNFATIMQSLALATVWEAVMGILEKWKENKGSDGFMSSLTSIAEQIPPLVEAISQFPEGAADKIAEFTEIARNLGQSTIWSALSSVLDNFIARNNSAGTSTEADAQATIRFMQTLTDLAKDIDPFMDALPDDIDEDKVKRVGQFSSFMQALVGVQAWTAINSLIDSLKPEYALKLSDFITNLTPFIDGLNKFTDDTETKVSWFGDFMRGLVEAQFWGLISSWVQEMLERKKDVDSFSENIVTMVGQFQPFLDMMGAIDDSTLTKGERLMGILTSLGTDNAFADFAYQTSTALVMLASGFENTGYTIEDINVLSDAIASFVSLLDASDGLTSNAETIKAALETTIGDSLSAIGESDVIDSGCSTAIDGIISALALYISDENKLTKMQEGAIPIGEAIELGIEQGLANSLARLDSAMEMLAQRMHTTFTNSRYMLIHSPSRAFAVLGSYLPAGLAQGVTDNVGVAEDSMVVLGSAVLAAMEEAMMHAATVADEDFEFHPMITPIVDMSNVDAASSAVNGALGGNYAVSAQMSDAIRRRMNDIEFLAGAMSGGGQTINGDNITVNVYPAAGQDPEAIADAVLNRISERSIRRGVAFG